MRQRTRRESRRGAEAPLTVAAAAPIDALIFDCDGELCCKQCNPCCQYFVPLQKLSLPAQPTCHFPWQV